MRKPIKKVFMLLLNLCMYNIINLNFAAGHGIFLHGYLFRKFSIKICSILKLNFKNHL